VELEAGSNLLLCRFLWRKKKHIGVARPGRVLKKEEEEEGEGVEGSVGWRRNVILVCSEGEIFISPLSPHF